MTRALRRPNTPQKKAKSMQIMPYHKPTLRRGSWSWVAMAYFLSWLTSSTTTTSASECAVIYCMMEGELERGLFGVDG